MRVLVEESIYHVLCISDKRLFARMDMHVLYTSCLRNYWMKNVRSKTTRMGGMGVARAKNVGA